MTQGRTITVDGLRAYVAPPDHSTTSGVLLLPTIAGIEDRIRDYCQWLNDAGLAALVWDPFSAYDADMPVQERLPIGREQLQDAQAEREQLRWLDYMRDEMRLQNVGVMGFCLGGRMVFTLSAAAPSIRACVAYHPSIAMPRPPHHLDAIAAARDVVCPVQVLYPGRDHVTNHETFHSLREALEARGAPTLISVFPDADHGFMEQHNPVTGVNRQDNPANVQATALAWPATAALFRSCLL